MDKKGTIWSSHFIIDQKKCNEKSVEEMWKAGNINFKASLSLCTIENKSYIKIHIKTVRSADDAMKPFSYQFGLYFKENNKKWYPAYFYSRKMIHSYDSFVLHVHQKPIFNTSSPKICTFYVREVTCEKQDESILVDSTLNADNRFENSYVEKLWHEKLFTDFVFKISDNEFPVHKSILAAQSDVFRLMFNIEHKMQENITNTAVITDISPTAFHQFLEYLYIRKSPKYDEYTIDLYKAAHKYDIEELKDLCESLIAANINSDNALEILDFAHIFDIEYVRKVAFRVIQEELFPERKLPQNLEYNSHLIRELMYAKIAYENVYSNITKVLQCD